MKTAAKIIAYIFHPLMLPTYSFILVIYTNPFLFINYNSIFALPVLKVFLNTFIFPCISLLMMQKLGFIESFTMQNAKDRIIPYISTLVFYIWTFMVFRRSGDPSLLSIIMLGACLSTSVAFVINMFRKISLHTTGMGAMVALAFGNAFFSVHEHIPSLIIICIVAGITGSSRLILKAHNNTDIYLGYFTGFMMQILSFRFL